MNKDDWMRYPKQTWDFLLLLWEQFKQDGCRETAAALTYTTLFAIVPVMTVTFAILHAMPQFNDQGQAIQNWLFSYFLPSMDNTIQQYLQGFARQAAHLTSIGIVFLVVTSVLMLKTIEGTMNRIWKIKHPRKGMTSLLMYWAVLTLGPICLGVGLGASSYVASASLFTDTVNFLGVTHLLLVLVPVVFSALLLTLLYTVVPNCHVPIRKGIIGGVVAAILFELAKAAFVQFVKTAPSYQLIYGAFAAVPLFLLWIFISWTIVLGGAELVHALVVFRETRQKVPHLQALLRLVETLWMRQKSGRVLKTSEIRKTLVRAGCERWDEYRNLLIDIRLMTRTDEGSYVLTRDLNGLTLAQLVKKLPWTIQDQLVISDDTLRPWEDRLKQCCDNARNGLDSALDMSLAGLFTDTASSEEASAASSSPPLSKEES